MERDRIKPLAIVVVAAAGLLLLVGAPLAGAGQGRHTRSGRDRRARSGSASILTRAQANAIALRVLRPRRRAGRVVLFGLPSPLAASQSVAIASLGHEGDRPETRGLKPVGRRVWLFWEDLAYDARFEHPSRLLLVDAATGRTLERSLSWFPLVDGRRPPFLKNPRAYASRRFVVYSSVRLGPSRQAAARAPAWTPSALPPNAFKDDCMIMIGRFSDPFFTPDFEGMANFGAATGLRTWWATVRREPSRTRPPLDQQAGKGTLAENVSWLIENENCRDVFIFVDGHGARAPEPAEIDVGANKDLSPANLADIISHHPTVTFKLKLDACFAGRFLEKSAGLTSQPNLLVAEASSRANETSWSMLGDPRDANGDPVKRKLASSGRGEFTNANIAGLEHFTSSKEEVSMAIADGGDLLAHALADGFYDGASSDAARLSGLTRPILYTNFATPPPPPPTVDCSTLFLDQGTLNEVIGTTQCRGVTFNGLLFTPTGGNQIVDQFPEQSQATCTLKPSGSAYCLFPSAVSSSGKIDLRFKFTPNSVQVQRSTNGGQSYEPGSWLSTGS